MKYFALPLLSCWLLLEVFGIAGLPAAAANKPSLSIEPAQSRTSFDNTLQARRYSRRSWGRRLPRRGAPRWSTGGAVRGGCTQEESAVIPLMPVVTAQLSSQTQPGPTFFGTTTEAYPTFYAYAPKTSAKAVRFELYKLQPGSQVRQFVGRKEVPLSGNPQVISVQFNGQRQDLDPKADYLWKFTTLCSSASGSPFIEGLVQRVQPDETLTKKLQPASPSQKVDIYAEAGIWLDTLNTMASLRCKAPRDQDITTQWTELIDSMDLSQAPELLAKVKAAQIPQAPLAQCSAVGG